MKIEIVEYYPFPRPRGSLLGSLHVYLCDFDIDYRGILVFLSKDGKTILYRSPAQQGKDPYTGQVCYYPFLSFTNKETNKAMMKAVKKLADPYIKLYCKNLKAQKDIAKVENDSK